jgi:hypothetical protein
MLMHVPRGGMYHPLLLPRVPDVSKTPKDTQQTLAASTYNRCMHPPYDKCGLQRRHPLRMNHYQTQQAANANNTGTSAKNKEQSHDHPRLQLMPW